MKVLSKTVTLILFFFFAQHLWAQSKNVIIESLTIQNDSLGKLLATERIDFKQQLQLKTTQLEQAAKVSKGLMEEIQANQSNIKELKSTIEGQKNEIRQLKTEAENNTLMLKTQHETIEKLTQQLDQALTSYDSLETANEQLSSEVTSYPLEKVVCQSNTISKTCAYRNYVFVTSSRRPDNDYYFKHNRNGTYTQILLKEGNLYNPISNDELINSLEKELVTLVNGQAVQDYQKQVESGKKPDCFREYEFSPLYLSDLEITMNQSGMVIYYPLLRNGYDDCKDFWGSYTLTLEQANRYLR
jgi:chromosome segregation ATPase